jgi:hypothetical protein
VSEERVADPGREVVMDLCGNVRIVACAAYLPVEFVKGGGNSARTRGWGTAQSFPSGGG